MNMDIKIKVYNIIDLLAEWEKFGKEENTEKLVHPPIDKMYVTKQEIESLEFAIEHIQNTESKSGLERLLRKVKRERIRHDNNNNNSVKIIESKMKVKPKR